MHIQLAKTENDFEKINEFFGKIWKQEFDLDRFNRIDEYKKSIVLFSKEDGKIISAISVTPYKGEWLIGRFAVEKIHRGKGLGKILFTRMEEEIKKKNIKKIKVFAEIHRVGMYEHFGFTKIGETQNIGNTKSIMMEKNYN